MFVRSRSATLIVASLMGLSLPACCCHPGKRPMQQCQMGMQQMYLQNRNLAMERDGYQQTLSQLAADRQRLEEQNQALKANLDLANQRLDNIASSNNHLEDKYRSLLTSSGNNNPLSPDQVRRFEELRQKYPEFEFDPQTGISKFSTDLLFASGSDEVTPRSAQILSEFAQIMNRDDAKHLKILVVGHTDDQPIARARARHATNWHLSTNRADSVVLALRKAGIPEARMGAAGYGMFQPLTPNTSAEGRQKNRRVEIFVLAPDATVAGWDNNATFK